MVLVVSKQPHQRGPDTDRDERRYGRGGLGPALGICTSMSTAEIRPDQFAELINARWDGAGIVERGGQTLLSTEPIHDGEGADIFPYWFDFGTPFRVWWAGHGCPGAAIQQGSSIRHFDFEQDPPVQRSVWDKSTTVGMTIGTYGGNQYVMVDDAFNRFALIPVPFGTDNIALAGTRQSVPVATFPGYSCNAIIEFDGLCFLALEDTVGAAHKIVTYDSVTIRDDLTGIPIPRAFGLYRDQLAVGFALADNQIRLRARGDSPGTYTTVAGPGIGTRAGLNSMISYKDRLYGIGDTADIWRYDGAALVVAHTVAGAILSSIETGFGYLYYGYANPGPIIGRYDNTAFVDIHKDLVGEVPTGNQVRMLRYHREQLVAGVRTGTDLGVTVAVSPGSDTAGTYEDFPEEAGPANIFYGVVM